MNQAYLEVTLVKDAKSAAFLKIKQHSQGYNICCVFWEEEDKGYCKKTAFKFRGRK